MSQLEDQRDERVAARITQLQAQCRGFLARKRLVKLKVLVIDLNNSIHSFIYLIDSIVCLCFVTRCKMLLSVASSETFANCTPSVPGHGGA